MSEATAEAARPELDCQRTGFFRFRRLDGKTLITNDFGRYSLLADKDFDDFVGGRLDQASELYAKLAKDGFIRDRMEFDALVDTWKRRNGFLWQGPGLHILVVTLRCNQRCLYCQATSVPMKESGRDMSSETARLAVDRIFESPNRSITIEFQGGEPLANWPVVKYVVDYAREKNEKAGKNLFINLVSNLTLLDQEKLDWLLDRKVNFCTSLDGPAEVHDKNRPYSLGSSHAQVVRWWKEILKRTKQKAFRIDALLTVTRNSLPAYKEIVDQYAALGSRGIYLRPLNPFGFAVDTWNKIGYSPEEFLAFYEKSLDYILEINKKKMLFEQTAKIFLAKILTDDDPNFLDLRSPCGAGIGQIAYDWDGAIYTCDEGRMMARMGDDAFKIGSVREGSYAEAVSHPVVKALAVASCLDNQVDCSRCVYKPYDGVCPIQCYASQGDIMGRMPLNVRCKINKGILDILFTKLQSERNQKIFRSWLKTRKLDSPYQRH